jgi:hypothetical protein
MTPPSQRLPERTVKVQKHHRPTRPQWEAYALGLGAGGGSLSLARLLWSLTGLPTRRVITEDGPRPTAELKPSPLDASQRHPHRACHQRAIHGSRDRSEADTHGQHHGGRVLHSFTVSPGSDSARACFGNRRSLSPRPASALTCPAGRSDRSSRRTGVLGGDRGRTGPEPPFEVETPAVGVPEICQKQRRTQPRSAPPRLAWQRPSPAGMWCGGECCKVWCGGRPGFTRQRSQVRYLSRPPTGRGP